jgi:hypothetical protein
MIADYVDACQSLKRLASMGKRDQQSIRFTIEKLNAIV